MLTSIVLCSVWILSLMAPINDANTFLQGLPDLSDVQARINKRYDGCFMKTPEGGYSPYVCCVCDEFIMSEGDKCTITFKKMEKAQSILSWDGFSGEDLDTVSKYYTFGALDQKECRKHVTWLKKLCLSPRGTILKKERSQAGFLSCASCKASVDKGVLPLFAIRNGNYTGPAPDCLTCLNEVELSFLTPVPTHGYCHVWNGGKQLKGTLTFMRVQERRIAKAAATLQTMGLSKNVIVLCHGKMTDGQRKRFKERTKVRTDKLIEAAQWLCKNHKRWQNVDYNELLTELQHASPIRVDHSTVAESTNVALEEEEIFTCYYPEGNANETSGGFDEPGAFKKFVEEMQRKNFDVEMTANLQKEFVKDDDNDQLIGSCLLQFPYGIGGLDEKRCLSDGSYTSTVKLEDYLVHLSKVSNPHFQKPMLQLIMYSMISRSRLLMASRLQVRGGKKAEDLAKGLNYQDLHDTITQRNAGNRAGGTYVSKQFLDSVEACTKSLPHTNQAAKRARSTGESFQHHFGSGTIFLTVTFDDENGFLVQVLADNIIDDDVDLSQLSDEDFVKRAKCRRELRLNFPGACAINFEMMLHILAEEVIGWNMKENCPMDGPGFFGYCDGMNLAVEEQGRKTLHGHMTLYIRGYRQLQHDMFFAVGRKKEQAIWTIQKYYDRIASTELLINETAQNLRKAWDHDCEMSSLNNRQLPAIVEDQEVRHFRHRVGCRLNDGKIGRCLHCEKQWTNEELISGVLENVHSVGDVDDSEQNDDAAYRLPTHRLHAEIVQYQRLGGPEVPNRMVSLINASYQTHSSRHNKSCFKCAKIKGKAKRKHVCGVLCECRYRLPDRKRKRTTIKTDKADASWFSWNGDEQKQPLVQILPKRGSYDLFQNISCRAVSESKFACNSNVSLITDGPIGQYQFKYQHKGTQGDDTAEYSEVDATIKKVNGRLHENDRSEAIRLVTRAAFAHNKTNVINAPLAAYLIRNNSRFYFSHDFQYVPLNDLQKLHKNKKVDGILKYASDGGSYFENQALHYLCRPSELDDLSLKDFFEKYEVTYVPTTTRAKKKNDVLPFIADTGYFLHPSKYEVKEGNKTVMRTRQGVKIRDEETRAKVAQWAFPDTGNFHDNIVKCPVTRLNGAMEEYAEIVLTLLYPHRYVEDLKLNTASAFPYTMKFREVYEEDMFRKRNRDPLIMFTDKNIEFLQNIQNARSNSLRYKINGDDLQSDTRPFDPADNDLEFDLDDDDDNEDDGAEADTFYEEFLQHMDVQCFASPHDTNPEYLPNSLEGFSFEPVRDRGTNSCGYTEEHEMPPLLARAGADADFIFKPQQQERTATATRSTTFQKERKTYSTDHIVEVLLRRTEAKLQKNVFQDKDITVPDANGTVLSIRQWGKHGFGVDRKQRRAFEAITAAFVLTFFEGAGDENDDDVVPGNLTKLRKAKLSLLRLKGDKKNAQLICLLHGPGGSGKSTVINMVQAYAKSFCESMGHPYTTRTIIITAMSGVAATLLHGETTHSVIGLNRELITEDEIEAFSDARLLVIDEISFASRKNFVKMYDRCRRLMQNHYSAYGGLNVVFAGDYSQLEPVKQTPIYKERNVPEYHGSINCFIELDGKWRFHADKPWGERMLRFREGCVTTEDIDTINSNCHVDVKPCKSLMQVATHKNKNRDAVNSAIFEEYCKKNKPADDSILGSAAVIFMDNLSMKNSKDLYIPFESNSVKRYFYEHCSESCCDVSDKGRVDPTLRLYAGCPMMLTENKDVAGGLANGSRARLLQVRLKYGEEPFKLRLKCGTSVNAMFASQVKCLVLEHECPDIVPRQFELTPENWTFTSTIMVGTEEITTSMKGQQFPVISNNCTTGHKLQGATCAELLVNEWNYTSNWAYVVLSRVKTMLGLYIRVPLTYDLSKYEKPKEMVEMLEYFRNKCTLQDISDEDYEKMETERY